MKITKTAAIIVAAFAVLTLGGCKSRTAVAGTSVTTADTQATAITTIPAVIETTATTPESVAAVDETEAANRDVDIIAAAVQESAKFPVMVEVDDPVRISDYFLINPDDYDETLVLQCVLSSNMTEMIIIKTVDTSAAEIALENRKKKAEEQDAFYPADLEKAKNAVIGSYKGYAYYIMSEDAANAEEALKTAVDGLEK
jgi:hypothetical protein